MTAYYIVRCFAGLFFMMSFGLGFLAGAQFGKGIGWLTFITFAVVGLSLHRIADKTKKHEEQHRANVKER